MKQYYPGLLLLVLTSAFSLHLHAQEFAILQKSGSQKEIYFKSGDKIRYQLKTDDHFRRDHIISVSDSGFQFHYYQVLFRDIAKVDIKGKRWGNFSWDKIGLIVQIAGVGYIVIDTFNRTVVQGNSFEFDEAVWITGGAMFLAGTAMRFAQPKRIKLGGRYRFRYLNLPLKY